MEKLEYCKETAIKFIKEGKSLKEISNYFNILPSCMGRCLRRDGIVYNLQIRKISKNHNFFEVIDSEIKAYILGFIVADGCVYSKSRFGICISEKDVEVVNLIKDYIAPSSLIKKTHHTKGAKNRSPQVILRISSTKLISDLSKYGITERKTYKPIKIPNVSEELKWHFIRGYFDGDGCISKRISKGYPSYRVTIANGDKTILEDIQLFCEGLGTISNRPKYSLYQSKNNKETYIFLSKMYNNANFYLKRKYDKFIAINTEVITRGKIFVTP